MRQIYINFVLFILFVAISIYYGYIPILREFNYDVSQMAEEIAKHPPEWINWGRIGTMICIALVMWRRDYDGDAFEQPGLWPSTVVALLFGVPAGWMLFAYLRERNGQALQQRID